MTSWIREAKARKYPPCPTCNAPLGQPCRTPNGRSRMPHKTRTDLAASGASLAASPPPRRDLATATPRPHGPEVYGVALIGSSGRVLEFDLEDSREQATETAKDLNAHLARLTTRAIAWKPARLVVDA